MLHLIEFTLELIVGTLLFMYWRERRAPFFPRAIIGTAAAFLLCVANDLLAARVISADTNVLHIYQYLFVFVVVVLLIRTCYILTVSEALFYACSGYALQNVAHYCFLILRIAVLPQVSGTPTKGLEYLIFVAIYGLAAYTLRKTVKRSNASLQRRSIIGISVVTLLFTVVLSEQVPLGGREYLLYYLYSLFGVLVVLFLQYGLFEKAVLQREKDVVEQLLAMESRQHKLSEETVALIELKCHDLKHQLAVLRQSGGADLAVVEDFQQTVDTYDSIIETGNSALNIILTEKSFLCERYGITLSCLVDGHLFDFMASSDLCSLFGNALDNAVEGVQHEAPENRFISVKSGRQGRLICLHIENYCGRALRFEDGLPVTTKEQTGFHGFGVKSIRFLAEKYGGHADMRLEDTRFLLTIIIPHPDEQ